MRREIPDIVRVLRTAAWMWLGYLLALIVVDAFAYLNVPHSKMIVNYLGNGAVVSIFLGFAYWSWLEKTLGCYYVPLMLLIISGLPLTAGAVRVEVAGSGRRRGPGAGDPAAATSIRRERIVGRGVARLSPR